MKVDDSPAEAAFRAEVRAWLDAHASPRQEVIERLSIMSGFRDSPADIAAAKAWQRTLADAGWAAITWPEAFGGRGAGVVESMVFGEELARYELPPNLFSIGIGMIGPTIIAHGTPEQHERYLRPMLAGDEIWCQLWSEPGAGSDLAGLGSRAVRDGDVYVLNGQKVWTSGAHYCDFGLGVFRSDVDVPKHKGITCLIVDMRSPGITIRPLKQITGESHFNEVFFDDVRVPVECRVGDEHDGWRVARTTMMNERLAAGAMESPSGQVRALIRSATEHGITGDARVRQALATAFIDATLFDLTTARVRSTLARGMIPGMEGSILKLALAELVTSIADAGVAVQGAAGTLDGPWPDALVGSFAMHIGGGTDEIQRNIIGETFLGLPREPDDSRELPYRALRRS